MFIRGKTRVAYGVTMLKINIHDFIEEVFTLMQNR